MNQAYTNQRAVVAYFRAPGELAKSMDPRK
jgi:hypothetical protein